MTISAFLHTLLTMTAAATVAALVVMALRLPLKRAPRWILCALWAVVLIRMVCPFSFEAPVSLTGQVTEQIPPPALLQVTEGAQPAPETALTAPAETTPVETLPAVEPPGPGAETILFALWLTGASGMLLWAMVSYLRLRHGVAEAVPVEGNVYETDRVASPFVCGFLKPRIYLPAGLSHHDRYYVLLHEEAHIRRRDYLTKPLAWLALSLHWFNPILWLAYRLYCRDVETACDQAVVRGFDRQDIAGYAAALLHLGRKTHLPQAVPLAFGEEDAKGRIKHVLDYRYPGTWVVIFTVVVVLIASVILLANQDDSRHGPQLEGITITQGELYTDQGIPLELPEEMLRQLVGLLNHYGHETYTVLEEPLLSGPRMVRLHSKTDTAYFTFEPDRRVLIRHSGDVYAPKDKCAVVDPALFLDEDYEAWLEAYNALQANAPADALYDLKSPYLGDHANDIAILDALGLPQVVGPYTIQLHTDEMEPPSIDVLLQGVPAFSENRQVLLEHLRTCGTLFLALVDNAQQISFVYETGFGGVSHSVQADPALKGLSREAFRDLCQGALGEGRPTTMVMASVEEVLYRNPASTYHETLCLGYPNWEGTFEMGPHGFLANINSPLSSSGYDGTEVDPVIYENSMTRSIPEDRKPVVDREGRVLLDPADYDHAERVAVLDGEKQFTGYVLFRLDEETYAAYYQQPGQLDYLVRLQ